MTGFRLDGRTALVTGASRGIGRAIAETYAAAGADVALLARDETMLGYVAAEVEKHGRRAVVLPCDVTDAEAIGAAVADAVDLGLPHPWLVGWSFGTDVVLRHGDIDPVEGAVLLSPPLRFSTDADLDHWATSGRRLTALVPEVADYLRPDEARVRFARVPQAEVVGVEGAKHLWVGEKYVRIVLDAIVSHLVPGAAPLPGEFDGPMERWNDL